MSYEPFEICHCHCHSFPEGTVKHVMACCFQCPHCGANINRGYIDEHEQRCKQERLDLGLPLDQYNILKTLVEPPPKPKTIHEKIQDEIDQEVFKELKEAIDEAKRREMEETPAVKFLRECQERERRFDKDSRRR